MSAGYKCPVCEEENLQIHEVFLIRKPKDPFPKPIICIICVIGLYNSIPMKKE